MALSSGLPIYKPASDLVSLAMDVHAALPRTHRQGTGTMITAATVEMVTLISRCNAAFGPDRVPLLITLLERLETVVVLVRICHAKKFISHGVMSRAIELTDTLGKQANGWLTHSGGRKAAPLSPTPAA